MLGTPADGGDTHVQAHAAVLGELERVREQILQYLQQALGVGGDRPPQVRIEVRGEGQLARVRLVAEIALDGLPQVREQQVFWSRGIRNFFAVEPSSRTVIETSPS